MEEKLFAILKELGIDKFADVLDGEQAEIDFTEAYVRSIRDPKNIPYMAKTAEDDFMRQVNDVIKIKELISENKDLTKMAVEETDFDLYASLRSLLFYNEKITGNPIPGNISYSITDPTIANHLNRKIVLAPNEPLPYVNIKDFPNEPGYFMLWELSISDDQQNIRYLPIFVNDSFISRPLTGRRIWEAILDTQSNLSVLDYVVLSPDVYKELVSTSMDNTYDMFESLKDETQKKREEIHKKFMYALDLRIEAAERIGIENIRKHKLISLFREKADTVRKYELSGSIFPEFRPVLMLKMEGGDA